MIRSVSLINNTRKGLLSNRAIVRAYHENIIDHYENPRNVGSLDKNKKNVGTGMWIEFPLELILDLRFLLTTNGILFWNTNTGLVGAPACGDVMKLQVEVDENGTIVDAKFKTFGCGSAIGTWWDFYIIYQTIWLVCAIFVFSFFFCRHWVVKRQNCWWMFINQGKQQ